MDALRHMKFKESEGGDNPFLKLGDGDTAKIRIFTTNPMVHLNQWGKEQYSFAVWNWDEDKAMILSKGVSIAKAVYELHTDEDWGEDITQLDVKLGRTGTTKEDTRYSLTPLPKPKTLSDEAVEELTKLDANLEKILKSGIRVSAYNEGERPEPTTALEEHAEESMTDEELDSLFDSTPGDDGKEGNDGKES